MKPNIFAAVSKPWKVGRDFFQGLEKNSGVFPSLGKVTAGLLLGAALARAEALPELSIFLGPQNNGVGLEVPSGGDGANVAVDIGGIPARKLAGPRAGYLYVRITHPAWTNAPCAAYVSAEVLDDKFARLQVSYDRASDKPDLRSRYTAARQTALLTGSGRWRTVTFHLPDLRLGHGQNNGADFRFAGRGLTVRRLMLSSQPPPGFDPDQPVDAETLRTLAALRPDGIELTFGNDATPADAQLYKALGVTSVESYVDWAGVEPEPGQWDWSKWDKQVAILQKAGLKWVPFLIAGPAYATPLWFQNSAQSRVFQCLEHGEKSRVQTLFNPDLRPRIRAFLTAFAERYAASNVIESVLLGVTGIYGESLYPAGPEGGWTAKLTGAYHNHHGWWAGDPLAVAAFRAALQKQYGHVAKLNAAWGRNFAGFDEVTTFLPAKAPNDRARADMAEWYQQAMTDWSVFWVTETRRALPKTEIYLCTGGHGAPFLGADFTAQAKAVAPLGAGVRITNEGSDYTHNFQLTREVATATRLYRTYCGFEPASGVTATGNIARIYNATASGARQLHCYNNNVLGHDADEAVTAFRTNLVWLAPRQPLVNAAIYLPRESWAVDERVLDGCYILARQLRDVTDLDFVTRQSIADGALKSCRLLVLSDAPVLEPAAAAQIEEWVNAGGTLVAATRKKTPLATRLYDNSVWRERLFVGVNSCEGLLTGRTVNPAGLAKLTRKVGLGRTVSLPGLLPDMDAVARVVAALLPGAPDGRLDGRFATQTPAGVLWYEAATGHLWLEKTP
jgi:hypothetical protein